ncbi:MAG: sigma-70 family RNA polymerase sigma factor [Chloroflexi bacterium]|nr:sigma-70 family RNA polymerase sigma factor [Chloroflexota bacterium]
MCRAQKGDENAFARLYTLYSPKIHSYLYYHLNGYGYEAEDLTNEVFVKVLEKIHTFEFRGLPFTAWLYRIAHNHLVDHVRGRPKQPCVPIEACFEMRAEDAQQELETTLSAEDLRTALVCITEEQRRVIVLRFVQGLNTIETAQAMGKSEDAVKKLQARGLQMLKKVLSEGRKNGRH